MKTITKKEMFENLDFYLDEIKAGKIFVYPTDTIYGIGCDAMNVEAIMKIRDIKARDDKPMSVIVPSIDWINENCSVADEFKDELNVLPGKYTFILKLENNEAIAKVELIGELDGLGCRMPDNWFSSVVSKLGKPFVTTSVNVTGEDHLINPEELKAGIESKIDYLIDDGVLENSPSSIISLVNGKVVLR